MSILLRRSGSWRHEPRRVTWVALLALVLAALPAQAAYMLPGAPYRPKDFAVVKQDGNYHVFYILNRSGVSFPNTELELGHAVSADLYHWTQLDPVLRVDSTSWCNSHIWAPSIVQRDGLWWMLFTGTTKITGQYNDTQRMGLAVSSDLMTWNRVEQPVFSATQVPWTWVDSLNSSPAFRDPYVMPDPTQPGTWLMYYTASYGPDSLAHVVGIARSDGDFTTWTDVGPLLITWRGYTYNSLTESPHMFWHDGLWYLVVTTSAGQPLSLYTAADPLAGVSGWTYRGRLRNMLGYDTSLWFASECFRDGTRDIFGFATGDRLEFREVQWSDGWSFSLVQPPYYHLRKLTWESPTVTAGDTARLVLSSANWAAGPPSLRTFVVDDHGAEAEVVPDSLGFPPVLALASDEDTLLWQARRWPRRPDRDTVTVTRVRVRASDSTAVSSLLTVHAAAYEDTTDRDGSGDLLAPPDDPPRLPVLRTLARSPLGDAPAAVVELAEAADVRLDLFDVQGRRVRNLVLGELPRGVSVLAWDGRGDDGSAQPRGVYFARLVAGRDVRTARLLLLPR